MWLLFLPVLIVGLVLLAVVTLAAGLLHLIGPAWPLLLIGLGAWMFWRGDRPRHGHRHRYQARNASRQPSSEADLPRARKTEPRTELPIDVQVKVEQIPRKVDVLLGHADRFPPFSHDLYLVRQTASDYLPRTIEAYLSLPRQAAQRPATLQELRAQLDLLDHKLDEIAQDLQRQDMDRLLANRRFLEERFGGEAARLAS